MQIRFMSVPKIKMSPSFCKILLVFLAFIGFRVYAQDVFIVTNKDSLNDNTYKQLYEKFHKNLNKNKPLSKIYAETYLYNGKRKNDSIRIAKAYSLLSQLYEYKDERSLTYLDSAITMAKNSTEKKFPEILYIKRAIIFENLGNFKNSLDDYLQALDFSKKAKNELYTYVFKHNIGLLKRKLGKYNESKTLLLECLYYEEKLEKKTIADTLNYLTTLSELVSLYRLNNQLDSSKTLNQKGVKLSRGKKNAYLFDLNEGILDYYDGNYLKARNKISNTIPAFMNPDPKFYFENYNLIDAYLHLARTYKATGQSEKAIMYFKKIDSISKLNYIIHESRLAYVELINHYKSVNDLSNQLVYINKLLGIDSVLTQNYRSTNDLLLKEFDTKELLEEKEIIIETMNSKNTQFKKLIIALFIIVVGALGLSYYQYQKQKIYAKRFKALLESPSIRKNHNSIPKKRKSSSIHTIDISDEIVNDLSEKIDNFEKQLDFLKPGITTSSLARKFNTNPKYISKVIHYNKKKNFTSYINDLRIDHVLEKLKTNYKLRNYTIKAISQEIGFSNTQSFSTYFYKRTGIYPSYFIEELKKIES
ncbi:helix-turn-helix domain-containing protein [Aquimarina algiphila]|uniref:helix-turn-helix domain-containing protein n=1 Tax=Aquimarina algiphila TaxID=2047982 RepID=UPI00232ACD09|nr:helix-turn-helix domain-containing protein [Aquimarina algiphila]